MLGKLFKYDFIFKQKALVIYYILIVLFGAFGRLCGIFEGAIFSVISKIFIGASISMMFSAVITCVLRSWSRFRINFYKDESYLTHSLPVTPDALFLAKFLSALASLFTSVAASLAGLLICFYSKENFAALKQFISGTFTLLAGGADFNLAAFLARGAVLIFCELLVILLFGYIGIVIGQRSQNNKIFLSVVIAICLDFAVQTVNLGVFYLFGKIFAWEEIVNLFTSNTLSLATFNKLIILSIAVYAAECVILYIIGNSAFKKGVNVE
ncbi:MAG: hypothetical protein KBS52_04955 [Clostridiales bacterium]|nr:hypothetical protein [Candidatus Equinaster intestinalis]